METLSWSLVEARLPTETPWVLSMGGNRGVRIGFDPYPSRLYARLPADRDMSLPSAAYSEIDAALRQDETGVVLEISTISSRYFREFHRFASLLAEEYERPGQTAVGAFLSAIQGWQEFAANKGILTPEQQVGLFGELLLVEALMRRDGATSINAWVGRAPSGPLRHDFRIGKVDLEVKTTRSPLRRHFVHGSEQLVPAIGHDLYVLSLRLEAGGANAGRTLGEQVILTRELADTEAGARENLQGKLESARYYESDEIFYDERFIMPDEPRLILVDERFPKITSSMLEKGLPIGVSNRIEQVSYLVNLEGLGVLEGSPDFNAILPNLNLELR